MSFDIDGWIEITRCEPNDPAPEHAWQAVLEVGPVIDVADEISERLFGLSKKCVTEDKSGLFGRRGAPPYPAAHTAEALAAISKFEERHRTGSFGGLSYAAWSEVKRVGITRTEWLSSEWRLIFQFIESLEADGRFTPDRIRIVVWYNW